MTRLIEILISLAIVAALMLIVGIFLPSHRHLSESVETNRKMTIVYDTLNSFHRFKDWNALVLRAPNAELEYSGPVSGVGAKMTFKSKVKEVGSGSWEIIQSEPGKLVKYAIEDSKRGHDKSTTFKLTPVGRGPVKRNVQITQSYDVEYGWNMLGRYAGLYVRSHVGEDLKVGMSRLTNMLSLVPNVDYDVEGSGMRGLADVQRPAEDLLVVHAGSIDRDMDKIKTAMKADLEWIKRTMDANGLVAAGPMRIISTELGRENYTFDVAQPVRKAGAGDKSPSEDKDKSKADETAKADADKAAAGNAATDGAEAAPKVDAMAKVFAAGEPLKVKIPDGAPVEYEQTKPGHFAMAYFTGSMAGLDIVRNALRAWAMTNGFEATDRPFEVYKNGIDTAFTADGEFEVYWRLKQ